MKEIFLRYKIVIARTLGSLLLVSGLVVYFWLTPKEVLSDNDIAAANVARMEASVAGGGGSSKKSSQPNTSKFLEELKNAQKKQTEYMTILAMVFGAAFLIYGFVGKKEKS